MSGFMAGVHYTCLVVLLLNSKRKPNSKVFKKVNKNLV